MRSDQGSVVRQDSNFYQNMRKSCCPKGDRTEICSPTGGRLLDKTGRQTGGGGTEYHTPIQTSKGYSNAIDETVQCLEPRTCDWMMIFIGKKLGDSWGIGGFHEELRL